MQGTTQITVVGNLVKEPFVREPSGYFVLRGTVAVNKKLKGKESTLFLEFEFWGDHAKSVLPFLQKGKPIAVTGELKEDSWIEKETGVKKSKMLILADKVLLLGGNSQEGKTNESTTIETKTSGGWEKVPTAKATPTAKAPQGWDAPFEGAGLSTEYPF